ncbi:hypothetical protein Goarm_006315 [Gossypium armourianum]|uniref:Transducin/WD40 repeat-like superfamily protein n=2 Tax=Gossypium armourianum TaxID=34283 RepID=A0A7J9JJA8_9ROSI|nr:hypothetical protein [Gossypium armourianum]
MEWTTFQHLDLRHVARGIYKPLQPHAAAFHPTQALVSAAIGTYIIEFDALTGSKLATIDIGSPVVRMAYSPTSGHSVVAILERVEHIRLVLVQSYDFTAIRQDCTIRSCDFDAEQTCVLHSPEKKTEHISSETEVHLALTPLQPVVFFGFHKRMSVTVVGTIEGGRPPTKIKTDLKKPVVNLACHPRLPVLYVAYAEGLIRAYNIHTYAVHYTLQLDNTIKLVGAGAFAFHPTLEWIFVGDRRAIESLDIPRILSQQGGEAVYPLPHIRALEVHPKLNLAALLFANMSGGDNMKNRASYTREGRKQLFAVLQSARGSSASVLKEKLSSMGSSGILADHQLQAQLQEQHIKGQSDLAISDIARKAFLYSHFMEGHAKTAPISRLPLISIVDAKNKLKDIPVCQPFHLELNFFNKENRVLHYPVRAFYVDGVNLMAYNLSSGGDSIYKKLFTSIPGNVEYYPKYMVYGKKRHLFLIVYEFSGTTNEVVLYWEHTDIKLANNKGSTIKGCDAAFIGPNENQFAILDEDKSGLALYILPGAALQEADGKNAAVEPNFLPDQPVDGNPNAIQGPMPFLFDTEIDRIFSTPIESTLMFACNGKQIGLAKLVQGYILPSSDGHYISTKTEGKKFIRLKANEIVLQVHWQETPRGYVAGVLTTHRVLMVSADLDVLASICILGWDGKVRTVLSISMPNADDFYPAALVGALNDRLLLANPTDINPRQKKGVEIKSCLVGLLEPLLIGFATMQQNFDQKLDLSEILYQITSRFDSLRITPRSLDILAGGPPVCGDLAVSLSQAGPQFTQVMRGLYAIKALRFSTALSVLKDEFVRSRDYPKCPPTSHLFHRFRQLGYACIKYGQFDSAKETFEVIADYESMLDLFICHLNPSAMRRLAQRLEEEGADSELRRYCERILRVRSSGWTQGIFANFAAESMVPKGPEWGGGNWEIKTPTNLKSIPQWELAAEVMPYMKTDDGAIPSIITDHIGVYLGSIKGRGNIIEVKEGSLVIPAAGDHKPNGVLTSVAKSTDSSMGVTSGETKAGSLMGLETLIKPNHSSTAADEQAKAAEEFKKTMYGTADSGSSSDEEGVSKMKKLQIRIREKPTSGTVDVNKIKEATKRLGDGLGLPIARTKSWTGQDLGQSQQQPYPATSASLTNPTVSAPGDLFGTDSWVQPALVSESAPATKGVGTAAGPIPEDFFQNTIPSLQVAAALPPPGSYLSKLDQTPQKVEVGGKVPPDHVNAPAADIGLPGGGVPPQSAEQPIPPESLALPGGGIPPQYSAPAAGLPQPQVQPAQMPLSTQPLDLSALGVPNSAESEKPTSSAPTPTSVRPGQVPRGAAAPICFKTGLAHLEQNQLPDSLSCFDEAFLALAKDNSRGADIKAQATICAQYKIAVTLLQEITRLQKVQGPRALSAKDEMARLSRHLGSLPLQAKHRINCIRTAIKRNMDVQNYAYAKQMLELLLSKAPPGKQEELRSLIDICVQRGLTNKSIDPLEDPSQFCAATLSRLSTIGYDVCDLCGAKFSALSAPGCIICGMGSIKRSDALGGAGPVPSPFG